MKPILVIANETVAGDRLRADRVPGARRRGARGLHSRLRHWLSDDDGPRAEAARRLEASLAALQAEGVNEVGHVGDSDPLQVLDDALRTFGADEVIVSTHPPGRSNWLERNVVARARTPHRLPIEHVAIDLQAERLALRAA